MNSQSYLLNNAHKFMTRARAVNAASRAMFPGGCAFDLYSSWVYSVAKCVMSVHRTVAKYSSIHTSGDDTSPFLQQYISPGPNIIVSICTSAHVSAPSVQHTILPHCLDLYFRPRHNTIISICTSGHDTTQSCPSVLQATTQHNHVHLYFKP